MYEITDYSKQQAKKLGVQIKPSTRKDKKIDVFKNDTKVASIGAKGYKDFPTYKKEKGLAFAEERRRLYKIRHDENRRKKGTAGFFADKILW
tara:strand:+ start:1100 stop:1375 length:276 start_codon:yes stop_codon:yes gene_type:complete